MTDMRRYELALLRYVASAIRAGSGAAAVPVIDQLASDLSFRAQAQGYSEARRAGLPSPGATRVWGQQCRQLFREAAASAGRLVQAEDPDVALALAEQGLRVRRGRLTEQLEGRADAFQNYARANAVIYRGL